ncbi:hypothetical protein CCR75_008021 [Bremia lactucae]|uniref:Uncharacterized protein n=1 Tax=Bremia lactucae TaxID=4779 RepID=A0A976FQY8_BRELC|nr:hypothetical protein CCR75_008021 [Bremia lactucae]
MHISWQGVPYLALGNCVQLVAADAIGNRRRTPRRLYRIALSRSRLRNRWRHRPHGMVCLDLQSPRWTIASIFAGYLRTNADNQRSITISCLFSRDERDELSSLDNCESTCASTPLNQGTF